MIETLGGLIDSFAARAGRTALIAFRKSRVDRMTYAELAHEIARLAAGFTRRGFGAGSRIALCAPNSPEWVIAYFAIVRAGATAVPIDHQATADTVATLLAHAEPALLLTTIARAAELGARTHVRALLLDAERGAAGGWRELQSDERAALPAVGPGDAAALLYTSGTTGEPKAVPLTHGNLAANTTALLSARLIGARDRVLLPLPLHHTYPFTVGLLTPLATGATVIFPAGTSGPEIARAAATGDATALLAVPRLCEALWEGVVAGVANRGARSKRLFFALLALSIASRRALGVHLGRGLFRAVHKRLGPHLRLIGCGGAKLPADLAWRLEGLGWTVLTGYGLTETSPVLTFNDHRHSRLGTEGRPLPGVEVRVEVRVDARSGTRDGEIVVRGPNVFAGYWRNAAATAAAFTPDGWFRTGDLGEIDARGFLRVVGRSKELLVLSDGKKVFAEPIEKLYAASDLFREVAILERNGTLVALVVVNEDTVRQRGAVREAALLREEIEDVAARLPPYQRITDYRVARTPLPRTQLGKLRRHLLPNLYERAAAGERPAAAPSTDADRALLASERGRAVWPWLESRFPDQPLTLDTSPQLDLQIDSLAWIALTIEIEERFHATLDGDAISRILTLRDLLAEIDRATAAAATPAATAEADNGVPVVGPPGPLLRAFGAALFAVVRLAMRFAFRLQVSGADRLPASGPLVITPNHASYLDPLAVAAALPWRTLRRTFWAGWVGVMFTGPLTRFVSRAAQVLPIDPDRDLAGAVRTARALLQQGYSIVWFPEGRRAPTGALGTFLPGIGEVLRGSGVQAVPTAIRGTFEAWPRQRRWPRLRPIGVVFGEPLGSFDAGGRGAAAAISATLEAAVRAALGEAERAERRDSSETIRPQEDPHAD